jgi:hypothetical protein
MRRFTLAFAVLAALVGVAVAHADKVKLNAADQALAKRIVLKASELGPGWSGDVGLPTNFSTSPSGGGNGSGATVVTTGAAEGDYMPNARGAIEEIDSEAEVFQRPAMLAAVGRMFSSPSFLADWKKDVGAAPTVVRLAVPKLAQFATGIRMTPTIKAPGLKTVHSTVDVLFLGKGRAVLTLTVIYSKVISGSAATADEISWARRMVARTPAS